jgi:alcohol dehydrogenase (cytochrome c)
MAFAIITFLGAVSASLTRSAVHAQGSTVSSGVFTAAQATRGQMVYNAECASCHLEDLSGGATSPPLKGDEFLSSWKGKTLGELFDEIKMTMPFSSPGSLTPDQYADALAYILSANNYKPGAQELAHEVEPLKGIQIDPAQ